MENFFQRQVDHLEFTTERMSQRAAEKKTLDAMKTEVVKVQPIEKLKVRTMDAWLL